MKSESSEDTPYNEQALNKILSRSFSFDGNSIQKQVP